MENIATGEAKFDKRKVGIDAHEVDLAAPEEAHSAKLCGKGEGIGGHFGW